MFTHVGFDKYGKIYVILDDKIMWVAAMSDIISFDDIKIHGANIIAIIKGLPVIMKFAAPKTLYVSIFVFYLKSSWRAGSVLKTGAPPLEHCNDYYVILVKSGQYSNSSCIFVNDKICPVNMETGEDIDEEPQKIDCTPRRIYKLLHINSWKINKFDMLEVIDVFNEVYITELFPGDNIVQITGNILHATNDNTFIFIEACWGISRIQADGVGLAYNPTVISTLHGKHRAKVVTDSEGTFRINNIQMIKKRTGIEIRN